MWKLSLLANAAGAIVLEERLGAALWPEPLAVTRFEDGPVNFLVEVYYEERPGDAAIDTLIAGEPLLAPKILAEVIQENWVAKVQATLSPVRAGRFVVHGSHDRTRVGAEPFAIEIDAYEAFGTAHHPTTLGCLIAIDRLLTDSANGSGLAIKPGTPLKKALDLGCGSGVLAIAIGKLAPDARILASDIDPRSVEIANGNFVTNGVAAQAEAVVAEGFSHARLQPPARFDLIAANILAKPLIALAPDVVAALNPDGYVILSGLLDEQAAGVDAAYRAQGLSEIERMPINGWTTLIYRKS